MFKISKRTQESNESSSIHKSLDEEREAEAAEITYEGPEEKQNGVKVVEAAAAVAGWKIYVAWIGLGLLSYCYGLDNNTMYAYLQAAATQFEKFTIYSSLAIVQQVLIAVAKLPIAKLSDVFGRAEAFGISLFFYVIGFIVIASAQTFTTLGGGMVLYAIGNTGSQICMQIVVADTVSSRFRGLAIGLLSLPYVINFGVAPLISAQLLNSVGWRWGPGVFSIIVPVATAPIIISLFLSQRQATRSGLSISKNPYAGQSFFSALKNFIIDVDLIGLLLICAGWLLILLPLNLAKTTPSGWKTGHIIAMLAVGGCCLVGTGIWETFLAPKPILKRRFVLCKDVILPGIIGFFDFFSFYCSWSSVFVWSMITYNYSYSDANYFSNTQSLCLTVFGIGAGAFSAWNRRYKWQMVFGAVIRLLGIGLMIRFRTPSTSTAALVIPQILQGAGGGILGITLQVSSQVNVLHQDTGMVTAFFLLFAEIGGACGSAVVGAVMTNYLPGRLSNYLPQRSPAEINALAQAGFNIPSLYPVGTADRTGVIQAWNDMMHLLLVIGVTLAAVPLLLSLLIKDRKLGKGQNCVSDETVRGIDKGEVNNNHSSTA